MPEPTQADPEKITPLAQLLINDAKICESLENLEKSLDRIDKSSMKQFAALIGVIMALIGSKLISTPWYVDVAVIVSLISGTFLAVTLIAWWKYYDLPQRVVRIISSSLLLFSSFTQIWIYQPGLEPAPEWFTPTVNGLLIALSFGLMWVGWTMKPKNGKHIQCNKIVK
jgi:ABC-type xylose transport system permease subunit